jgi:hypothetical protein
MSKKSPTQRIARLEDIVIAAGHLVLKLKQRYSADFGVGIDDQVNQFMRDALSVEQARNQRLKAQEARNAA